MDIKISSDEAIVLKEVLRQVTIRTRTGALGIMHGMDRFVATNVSLRKQHLELLDQTAKKLGLTNGINRTDK